VAVRIGSMMLKAVLLAVTAITTVSANPSYACGKFLSTCVAQTDSSGNLTGFFATRNLFLQAFTYPMGLAPFVDAKGTTGSYFEEVAVFSEKNCNDFAIIISRAGQWSDLGIPAGSSTFTLRNLVFDDTTTSIQPSTSDVVTKLSKACSCGDSSAWKLNTYRTITVCPGSIDCNLSPYLNYVSPGIAHYGIAWFEQGGQISTMMNLSYFVTDNSQINPSTPTPVSFKKIAACSVATVDPMSVCGNYQSDPCRAANDGNYNVITSISFSGDDVGQFVKKFTLYDAADTQCTKVYVASYTMTGVFAVHGGSDCSGTCLNGTAMELFVNYADFDSKNANQTAMLNQYCPCGTTWSVGVQQRITQCPMGTCTLYNLDNTEITHGLPVGTTLSGFGTVLNVIPGGQVSQLAMTKFSTGKKDYSNTFTYDDYAMINGVPEFADCTNPGQNTPLCGTYETYSCMGVSGGNAQLSLSFFGTSDAGAFNRSYKYWSLGTQCSGIPDIQYDMQGTYAVHGLSTCGGDCIYNTTFQLDFTVTVSTITANTIDTLAAVKSSCKCGRLSWQLSVPTTVTICINQSCDLSGLLGVDGLVVGNPIESYATMSRFADKIVTTDFNADPSVGYGSSFSSNNLVLFNQISSTCPPPPPVAAPINGVYSSGCRAGVATKTAFIEDNVLSTVMFTGSDFSGAFNYKQDVYNAVDTSCATPTNIFVSYVLSGYYLFSGPSTCAGLCTGGNVQNVKITPTSTVVTPYGAIMVAYLNSTCPCSGTLTWADGVPTTVTSCPLTTCALLVLGFQLGTTSPFYGNMMNFQRQIIFTSLKADVSGYNNGFDSQDEPYVYSGAPTPPTPAPTPPPSTPSLTGGASMLIAFFSISSAYVIFYVIINSRAGATGRNLLPHTEFWGSLPGLIKDGVSFTMAGFKGPVASGSYQTL